MHFTLGLALALSQAITGGSLQSTGIVLQAMPQAQTVEEYVREYYADTPILADIAGCESKFRQYDKNGSVLHGEVVYQDIGLMQVNETYHKAVADKLGLDINTMQGNLAYAKYLYEKEGTTPWNSSKVCWGKSKNAQVVALNITK